MTKLLVNIYHNQQCNLIVEQIAYICYHDIHIEFQITATTLY